MKSKRFAYVLKDLMSKSNVKNSSLATSLRYDISYVSKWTSGSNLPAAKYYEEIIASISECLVREIQEATLPAMLGSFGAENRQGLIDLWRTLLTEAYERDRMSVRKTSNIDDTAPIRFSPIIPLDVAIEEMKDACCAGRKLYVVADILGMNHESMLHIIGAEDGILFPERALGSNYSEIELLISLPENMEKKESIDYDFLSFIHLICALSYSKNLKVYVSDTAKGKIIALDPLNGILSSITTIGDSNNGFSFVRALNNNKAQPLETEITSFMTQSSLAFSNFSFHDVLHSSEYVKTYVAHEARWLIGHITEVFMPCEELKMKCANIADINNSVIQKTISRIEKAVRNVDIEILLYESAIADFVMHGVIDIYNTPVLLSVEERKSCLKTIKSYLHRPNINLRLIRGGFAKDFKRTPNPCMFSSSLGACLRVENGTYKNNIFSNPNHEVKKFIELSFNKLWNREDVIMKDTDIISSILESYINGCEVFC